MVNLFKILQFHMICHAQTMYVIEYRLHRIQVHIQIENKQIITWIIWIIVQEWGMETVYKNRIRKIIKLKWNSFCKKIKRLNRNKHKMHLKITMLIIKVSHNFSQRD